MPKAIYLMNRLPSTAVGTVFKLALSLQATILAVTQKLQRYNINATVTTQDADTFGFIVLVKLANKSQQK